MSATPTVHHATEGTLGPTGEAAVPARPESVPTRVKGIDQGSGEIVILATRQHWSAPAMVGWGPSAVLVVALLALTSTRASPIPANILAALTALALVPAIAATIRHRMKLFVLTDRRAVVRAGRGYTQVPLREVRRVRAQPEDPERRRAWGDVWFESEQGKMLWDRVPSPGEIEEIARDAVRRFGRGA